MSSLCIQTCHTASLSLNYTNFDKCSSNSIKLFDSAVCANSGIQLTGFDYYITGQDYLTEWAVFGFSASTAFRDQSHIVKTWSFSSDLDSEGAPTMVKQGVNKNSRKKTNKSLTIGVVLGSIGALAIIIIVVSTIWVRSNKRPGPHLSLESGRKNPECFLRARAEHPSG
ncbi:hypothetical protein LINPERHAP1_LOCUS7695 [Linum perenne]